MLSFSAALNNAHMLQASCIDALDYLNVIDCILSYMQVSYHSSVACFSVRLDVR